MQEGARDESGGGIPNSTYFPYLIFIMSEGMSNLSNGFRGIERVFLVLENLLDIISSTLKVCNASFISYINLIFSCFSVSCSLPP